MKQIEYFKMISGELYNANDTYLRILRATARAAADSFNALSYADQSKGMAILGKTFRNLGENANIKKPIYFDYGLNISIGDNFYANYDLIMLDVALIKIGNNVMFGPRVSLYTAGHPVDPKERQSGLEFGKPITIEDNVWVGGNTVINPGVTIGKNSVVGSGSVVTKDIPANVVAAGNPCRVIRKIAEN